MRLFDVINWPQKPKFLGRLGAGAGELDEEWANSAIHWMEDLEAILDKTLVVSAARGGLPRAAAGDILYANVAPTWVTLAHPGGANQVLESTGTILAWTATPTVTGITLTGLTPGQVPYFGVGGLVSDDPFYFSYNAADHGLIIGNVAGASSGSFRYKLSTVVEAADSMWIQYVYSDQAHHRPEVRLQRSRGSVGAEAAVELDDQLGQLKVIGMDNTPIWRTAGYLHWVATEDWTGAAQGAKLEFYVTIIGSVIDTLHLTLAEGHTEVAGDLRVQQNIGRPDDTDLIQLTAANLMRVNGALTVTNNITVGVDGAAEAFVTWHSDIAGKTFVIRNYGDWVGCISNLTGGAALVLRTGAGGGMMLDVGGDLSLRDRDAAYATRFSIISATGQVRLSNGSAAVPILSFLTNTNKGFFSPGANLVALSLVGTERFRWSGNDVGMVATGRIYLDGVDCTGDTYIYEHAIGNIIAFSAGGNLQFEVFTDHVWLDPSAYACANNGDVTMDPTRNALKFREGGVERKVKGQTDVEVATYSHDTVTGPVDFHTYTIPAADWAIGKTWHFKVGGHMGVAGGIQWIQIIIELGGDIIGILRMRHDAGGDPVIAAAHWQYDLTFTCRTLAVGGRVSYEGSGFWQSAIDDPDGDVLAGVLEAASGDAINTTANQVLRVRFESFHAGVANWADLSTWVLWED